jgi:lipoprotein-anchoring transpeptidase ErfK/SrfK
VQDAGANVRSAPQRDAPLLAELPGGAPVRVLAWVQGDEVLEENPVWAKLADGGYVFSAALRAAPMEDAPTTAFAPLSEGRWIDVDVVSQTLVAYEGAVPIRRFLVSTGRPGWDTPLGEFAIARRVERETMDAATLRGAIPAGQAAPTYKIQDVRYTQYFTADGAAFHENTWRSPELFGLPGSHGCVSLHPADAAWLWQWAQVGTPVRIHG